MGANPYKAAPDFNPDDMGFTIVGVDWTKVPASFDPETGYYNHGEQQVRDKDGNIWKRGTNPDGSFNYRAGYTDTPEGRTSSLYIKDAETGKWKTKADLEEDGSFFKGTAKSILSDKRFMAFVGTAAAGAAAAAATGSTAMAGLGTEGAVGTFGATGAGSGAIGYTGAAGAAEAASAPGWSAAMDTAPGAATDGVANSGWSAAMDTAPGVATDSAANAGWSAAMDTAPATGGVAPEVAAAVPKAAAVSPTATAPAAATSTTAGAPITAATPSAGGGSAVGAGSKLTLAQSAGNLVKAASGSITGGGSFWGQILSGVISGVGNSMQSDKKDERAANENKRQEAYKARNMGAENIPQLNWSVFRPVGQAPVIETANKTVAMKNRGIIAGAQ